MAGAAEGSVPPTGLAVHSGAGALVPAIVAAAPALAGVVFADAGLPAPGAAWLETAPGELRGHLLGLAAGGGLPPWHRWFPPETLAEVLPDPAVRAAFTAELRPLPVAWFAEPAPAAAGWPVERVTGAGGHLAMLAEADGLAGVLGSLTDRLAG